MHREITYTRVISLIEEVLLRFCYWLSHVENALNLASSVLFSSFPPAKRIGHTSSWNDACKAPSSPVARVACLHFSHFSIVLFFLLCLGKSCGEDTHSTLTAQSFYIFITDICQPRWSYFGGYCYFTSRACASWLTAESNCSTMSSNLVTVHNQEENVYIQHRHNGERSWIGLNDRSVEGSFVWTNKEISKFRFWAPQQPNDWKNEDCVHTLGAKHGYTWNDVPCTNCYNYTCFKGTKRSKVYNTI